MELLLILVTKLLRNFVIPLNERRWSSPVAGTLEVWQFFTGLPHTHPQKLILIHTRQFR